MSDVHPAPGSHPPRREFLKTAGAIGVGVAMAAKNAAAEPTPPTAPAGNPIPLRPFGRHADVKLSALGMGGHHIGEPKTVEEAIGMVHDALDAGLNFFDNCWEYYNGKSENWLGRALKAKRDKAFLMSKVCTHGRGADLAMKMLEQSLRRLQTDHLDLWQIHGVTFDNDPDLAYAKGGVLEAFEQAKKVGKVRFVGFTGHKDADIHLKMIQMGYPFDSVQMPLNCFDYGFDRSFEKIVLPEAVKRGIAVLGMKAMGGTASGIKQGVVTAEEMLRYAMSIPGVTVTISGMDKPEVLKKNLAIAQGFQPLSAQEMDALRAKCAPFAADGRFELYKTSIKYDNPQARLPHDYPLDPQIKELKQMFENATGGTPH